MRRILAIFVLVFVSVAYLINRPISYPEVVPIIKADSPIVESFIFRANVDGSDDEPHNCYLNVLKVKKYLTENLGISNDQIDAVYVQTLAAWYQAGIVNLYGENQFSTPHSLIMMIGDCAQTEEGIKAKANIEFLENEMKSIVPKLRYHWSCNNDAYNHFVVSKLMEANGNPNPHATIYYQLMFDAWGWVDFSSRKIKSPLCHRWFGFL